MGGIKLNLNHLNKAIDNAFASVVAKCDSEYIAVIEDPDEFSDLGFDSQDIVLTGALRDSQVVNAQGNKATWEWNPTDPDTGEAYALAVWVGFFAYGGHKFILGRKWALRALKRVNPAVLLALELQNQGIAARVVRNDAGLLD